MAAPRKPTQARWDSFSRGAAREVDRVVSRYQSGRIAQETFREQFRSALEDKHSRACFLGRQRAGDMAPFEEDDKAFGQEAMRREDQFFDRFMQDIAEARYVLDNGEMDWAAIRTRAHMYEGKLLATANDAFCLTSGALVAGEMVSWRLGYIEDHCSECPDLAAGSPYQADHMTRHPRDGSSPCTFNCGCFLVRHSDNLRCFMPYRPEES